MKLKIDSIIALSLMLLAHNLGFCQTNKYGMTGMVDLKDHNLFVNISSVRYISDNEQYSPSLFTVEIPNDVENYWFELERISEFLFKFEKDQFVFIFDDVKANENNFSCKERELYKISKDSADVLIKKMSSSSLHHVSAIRNLDFESTSNHANGQYFMAICNNVYFVFYNISNLNIKKIINSFILIQPHGLQIIAPTNHD